MMEQENETTKQDAAELIQQEQFDALGPILALLHPADIADLIETAPEPLRPAIFGLLDDECKADVLSELDDSVEETLLDALSPQTISEIAEEMAPDDAADMLGEMDEARSESILNLMDAEDSEDVRELLSHDEDTAGGLMTTDFVSMPSHKTAAEALEYIGSLELEEPLHIVYVTDADGKLEGYVQLWKVLNAANRKKTLAELEETDLFFARTDTDQEEVARMMSKYNMSSFPVLDAENRLVGRVTIDDVVDVLQEEASEDIFKLAGSSDDELEYSSPFQASKARLPWLLITLGTGLVTSMILKAFMHSIDVLEVIALSFFVPIVMAMGGNTGIQSSTLIVRGLALGSFNGRKLTRVLIREMVTGMMMGSICAVAIGLWAQFIIGATTTRPPVFMGFAVGLALFCAMMFAATFGASVPLLLNRWKLDPAVASGPFVTASNDIIALLIYYGIVMLLITTPAA
ncbi:MAG TPA: magnesium transporter [Verrucomicrobia bacterium]|nr:magnesium transporter [Verrucomicrobiota bacterium]